MAKASCCAGAGAGTQDSPCSGTEEKTCGIKKQKWMTGFMEAAGATVPKVSADITFSDTLGAWKARWNINRMNYSIDPGLYAIGGPDETSPVLVTANYKMTFDKLRKELAGMDAWILVLDTKGINVWCAAGKGTFGTEEIVEKIKDVRLDSVVSHRKLILPQLGAPGVSAHEVLKRSGFHVVYGPVKAKDIKEFMALDMQATKEMRRVNFTALDRLVLAPVEVVSHIPALIVLFGIMFVLNAAGIGNYGFSDMAAWLGGLFAGCVLTPILLPWLPGRALSFKGAILGAIWVVGLVLLFGWFQAGNNGLLKGISYLLLLPAFSGFSAMNFTGATTYTSLSGVDKEMKIALPVMIIAGFLGAVLLIVQSIAVISV